MSECLRSHPSVVERAILCSRPRKRNASNPRPVLHVSGTAFGMVGPGLPLPAGVPANFALKQVATTAFFEGRSRSGKSLGNLKHERLYREFFDDLAADRAAWLPFLEHEENHQHAENTCGILGTLATIYRQRGALYDCEAVLDMEQEVLARYERVSVRAADPTQVRCCEALAYKYRVIRYNLCLQRQRFPQCVELYRCASISRAGRPRGQARLLI